MTNWKEAYSSYDAPKPAELDTTSSPTDVYERKDFEIVTHPAIEEGEEERKEWKYLERTLSREEYNLVTLTTEKVELRHENDIRDDYMVELIEGGII